MEGEQRGWSGWGRKEYAGAVGSQRLLTELRGADWGVKGVDDPFEFLRSARITPATLDILHQSYHIFVKFAIYFEQAVITIGKQVNRTLLR